MTILRFNFRAYSWHYLFLLLLVRWFFSFREHVWRRGVQCACSGAWKIGEQLRLFDSCRRRRSAEHCAPPSARAGRAARRGARLSRMTSPCGDGLRVAAQRGARWARRGCGPGAAPSRAQKETPSTSLLPSGVLGVGPRLTESAQEHSEQISFLVYSPHMSWLIDFTSRM